METFFEKFNRENPAEYVNGKVIETHYSNGFMGEVMVVYAKVKSKTVSTQFSSDNFEQWKSIKIGDTVKVRKQRMIGYSNRYEYKITELA